MSIAQVKKQFEEFAAYLGRDVAGLERLKKLKDAVNELRTRLASAEAKEASAAKAEEAMANRARTAEQELDGAKNEIQRLQQLVRNVSRDMELATARDVPDETEDYSASPMELRTLKRLRSRLKHCPRIKRMYKLPARSWDRDSIAKGWSHDAIWTLGAAMAVLVTLEGVVVLESQDLLRYRSAGPKDGVARSFVKWFVKNNMSVDQSDNDFFVATGGQPSTLRVSDSTPRLSRL